MNEDRQLFYQSLIPRLLFRPSWRRALGWGSILGDFTLAALYPGWRLGCLILPAWLLLALTRHAGTAKAGRDSGPSQGQRNEKEAS
jgi:hypothetical protein